MEAISCRLRIVAKAEQAGESSPNMYSSKVITFLAIPNRMLRFVLSILLSDWYAMRSLLFTSEWPAG
jgi:hypothetical protein